MKRHKISTHLAYSDNCYFHFFYWLSDWVEILQGFMKFNFKLNLKVSAFYLEKQKSFIPKKNNFFGRWQYQNKKALFTDSIFQKVLVRPCCCKGDRDSFWLCWALRLILSSSLKLIVNWWSTLYLWTRSKETENEKVPRKILSRPDHFCAVIVKELGN